jgi:hypothetical protein
MVNASVVIGCDNYEQLNMWPGGFFVQVQKGANHRLRRIFGERSGCNTVGSASRAHAVQQGD